VSTDIHVHPVHRFTGEGTVNLSDNLTPASFFSKIFWTLKSAKKPIKTPFLTLPLQKVTLARENICHISVKKVAQPSLFHPLATIFTRRPYPSSHFANRLLQKHRCRRSRHQVYGWKNRGRAALLRSRFSPSACF